MALLLEYKFYSEKCRLLLQTTWGWPVPPALGVARNQSSSSTSIALHIQESEVMCPLGSFSLHRQQNWRREQYYSKEQPHNCFKLCLLFQYQKLLSPTNATRFLCSSPATRCRRSPRVWNALPGNSPGEIHQD